VNSEGLHGMREKLSLNCIVENLASQLFLANAFLLLYGLSISMKSF
jgi:hypothetical protein